MSSNGDQGFSTQGCEVSNSENSSEAVVVRACTAKTNAHNGDFSNAAETLTSNENSSSNIEESIENIKINTSKSQTKKSSMAMKGRQSSNTLKKKS